MRRDLRKSKPDLAGFDRASGFSDKPSDCLKRIKSLFEKGAITSDNEPDLAELERTFTTLLTNPTRGLSKLKVLAARGSIISELYIAEAYRTGIAGKADITESADWYRRASRGGSAFAAYRLGRLYLRTEQYFNARECFETAASTGFIPAICAMGYMYAYGLGVREDWNRARELLENASAQGHIFAKGFLASMLVRRHWGWFQVLRGLLLACVAVKDVIVSVCYSF